MSMLKYSDPQAEFEPSRFTDKDSYIVVRRGDEGWNVVQVEPKGGLLLSSVKAVLGTRGEAWRVARRGSAHHGIPLLEGAQ